MHPYFSIIISVYNKAAHLSATIDSVLNQSFSDFEVIIINDGSTDDSKSILDAYNDARIHIVHQDNQGVSAARNRGIALAKSANIALLDGDDLWLPSYLKRMYDTIQAYTNESVFTSAIAHKYEESVVPVPYSFNQTNDTLILNYFEASQKHSALSGSSIVFKKTILETTGEFDTNIRSGEDTDLWIRIGIHFQIVFICEVLVHYVFDLKSLSNTNFNIEDKPKFENYKDQEDQNTYLKKFIDRNRFSLAVMSKLNGDRKAFSHYRNALEMKNLTTKRQLILQSPKWLITFLLKFKALGGKKLYYKSL